MKLQFFSALRGERREQNWCFYCGRPAPTRSERGPCQNAFPGPPVNYLYDGRELVPAPFASLTDTVGQTCFSFFLVKCSIVFFASQHGMQNSQQLLHLDSRIHFALFYFS